MTVPTDPAAREAWLRELEPIEDKGGVSSGCRKTPSHDHGPVRRPSPPRGRALIW